MKNKWTLMMLLAILASCNNNKDSQAVSTTADSSTENFFPVTSYLRGQIAQLKQSGINPQVITITNNKQDTTWLKIEEFDETFKEFLQPEIDSTNLKGLFKESKFADQTLDSYTFTYDPASALPANMPLQKWDVYINPNTNTVQRIYMVKKNQADQVVQLTWQSEEFSKIVYLGTREDGNQFVEKEIIIKWHFE